MRPTPITILPVRPPATQIPQIPQISQVPTKITPVVVRPVQVTSGITVIPTQSTQIPQISAGMTFQPIKPIQPVITQIPRIQPAPARVPIIVKPANLLNQSQPLTQFNAIPVVPTVQPKPNVLQPIYQPIVYSQRSATVVTSVLNLEVRLTPDCFLKITQYLDYSESLSLRLTCQTLYGEITRFLIKAWPSHTLGGITLRHLQHVASSYVLPKLLQRSNPKLVRDIASPDGTYSKVNSEYPPAELTALSSPMGFGKTLVMLHFLISQCSNLRTIVTMPPHVLKCWVTQLEMLGLMNTAKGRRYGYHADPGFSYALILHTSRAKHKSYVLGTPPPKNGVPPKDYKPIPGIGKANIFANHSLILVTDKTLKNHADLLDLADLLVVDECHKVKGIDGNKAPLYLGLSGETAVKLRQHQTIEIGHKVRVGPQVIATIHKAAEVNFGFGDNKSSKQSANDFFNKNTEKCLGLLKDIILKHSKVTLSIDGGAMGKTILQWLTQNIPQYRQFVLKTSDKTVRDFESYYGQAILIINTASNEGLSIYTGVLIVLFPELYAATRLRQLRGRVTRPNTPFPEVHIHWICMGKYGYSKLKYVEYASHLAWNKPMSDSPNPEWLSKCEDMIRLLGRTVDTISAADACIIYNHEKTDLTDKLEFWLNYSDDNSVLTEAKVRGLLNIKS